MNFGDTLKSIRKAKKVTQKDLAEVAGVDVTYISKLENKKLLNSASAITISKFCDLLGSESYIPLMLAAGKCIHCKGTGRS